ncbi:MAG: signal peptidase I, partial [Actinomycetota bacterium]|nr:signal peptidase I [Actinomycetota bacterium]
AGPGEHAAPVGGSSAQKNSAPAPWQDWVVRSDAEAADAARVDSAAGASGPGADLSGDAVPGDAVPGAGRLDGARLDGTSTDVAHPDVAHPVGAQLERVGAHPVGAQPEPGGVRPDDAGHAAAVSRWRQQSSKRNRKAKRPFWVELPILIVVAFALTFVIQTFIAKVYYVPSGSMEQTLHGVSSGGDRILASKIVYDFRDPRQGDVVVFKGPDTWAPEADIAGPSTWVGEVGQALGSVIGIAPPNEKDFVKRVVAVGGQTVACCDEKGNVTVDGRSLNEPYIYEPLPFQPGVLDCSTKGMDADHYASQRCFAPFKVPAGQLWVMGDHRGDSADSSYNCWGLKPAPAAAYLQPGGGKGCARPIPVDSVIGKAVFIVMPPSRWSTIGNPDIDPRATALASGPVAFAPLGGGLLLTVGLRGSLAMVPSRRRRRRQRRALRAAAAGAAADLRGRPRP